MRQLVASLAVACLGLCLAQPARATKIYESATMGASGQSAGVSVNSDFFVGVRFQASATATSGSIGGHFGGAGITSGDIFAVVLKLSSLSEEPDASDLTLSNPNLLGVALITLPSAFAGGSDEFAANLAVDIAQDEFYALIFGSGLFGASGSGFATKNNTEIGTPSYFNIKDGAYLANNSTIQSDTRFFLDTDAIASPPGVPEPSGIVLWLVGAAALPLIFLRRKCAACFQPVPAKKPVERS